MPRHSLIVALTIPEDLRALCAAGASPRPCRRRWSRPPAPSRARAWATAGLVIYCRGWPRLASELPGRKLPTRFSALADYPGRGPRL